MLTAKFTFAQIASDALRYSWLRSNGTAKNVGLSGAQGALGADITAVSINPGGLGVYRKSDFGISLEFKQNDVSSILQGDAKNTAYNNLSNSIGTLSNLNLIISSGHRSGASPWKTVNFSLGYNELAQYKKKSFYSGSSRGSITDRFLELSLDKNGSGLDGLEPNDLDNFEAGLAYEVGAIFDPNDQDGKTTYTTDLLSEGEYVVQKNQNINEKGFLGEVTLGLGGNYNEKLFLGGQLAFPTGKYSYNKVYNEKANPTGSLGAFHSLQFTDDLNTEIDGFRMDFGAIYKPIQSIRVGLAYHTPSWLSLTDKYKTSLSYSYYKNNNQIETNQSNSPDGEFEYKLRTPQKLNASIAIVNKMGLISLDWDYVNYANAKFNLTSNSDSEADYVYQEKINADIQKQYKASNELRLGIEIALEKLRLRVGTSYNESPFANDNEALQTYSAGIGYRGNKMYFDLGYQYGTHSEGYIPYYTGESDFDGNHTIDAVSQLVQQDIKNHLIRATWGVRF